VGGSAFSPAALHWNPRRQSREFARELRCMDERTDQLVRCLRLKDWRLLVAASKLSHSFESNTFRYWFRPVIDRNSTYSLIRDHPAQLYNAGHFLRVPLMGGLSAHEGSLEFFINWHQLRHLSSLERIRFLIRPYLYEFSRSEIVATTLDYNYVKRYNNSGYALSGGSHFHHNGHQLSSVNQPVVLANRLTPSGLFWHQQAMGLERNEYDVYISPNDQRSKEIARQIDAIGDFLHVAPLVRQLELHSRSVAQTYLFVFDFKGVRSFGHIQLNPYGRSLNIDAETQTNGWLPSLPSSTGPILSSETSNFGVTHNDDLFYLLPNDFAPLSVGDAARPSASGSPYQQLVYGGGAGGASSSPSGQDLSNEDNVVRNYVTYLVAFVARVNEQQQAANNLANWLPFRATDRNYLRFSEQVPTLYKNFHQTDVAFVNELVEPIEELVNTPLPLFPYEELRDFKVSTAALGLMLLLVVLTLALVACLIACRRRRRRQRHGLQQRGQQRAALSGKQATVELANQWQQAAGSKVAPPPPTSAGGQAQRQLPSLVGRQVATVDALARLQQRAAPNTSTPASSTKSAPDFMAQANELAARNERTLAELEGRLSRLSQR